MAHVGLDLLFTFLVLVRTYFKLVLGGLPFFIGLLFSG